MLETIFLNFYLLFHIFKVGVNLYTLKAYSICYTVCYRPNAIFVVPNSQDQVLQIIDRNCLRLLPNRNPTVHDFNATIQHSLISPPNLIRPLIEYIFDYPFQCMISLHLYSTSLTTATTQCLLDLSPISNIPDRPDREWVVAKSGIWCGLYNFSLKTSELFMPRRSGGDINVTLVRPYVREYVLF